MPAQCDLLAARERDNCGEDYDRYHAACKALSRAAEAASCVPQALRGFDCELRRIEGCTDQGCCRAKTGACDETNTDFDHCIRGYCGSHAANPDCEWIKQTWDAPAGSTGT